MCSTGLRRLRASTWRPPPSLFLERGKHNIGFRFLTNQKQEARGFDTDKKGLRLSSREGAKQQEPSFGGYVDTIGGVRFSNVPGKRNHRPRLTDAETTCRPRSQRNDSLSFVIERGVLGPALVPTSHWHPSMREHILSSGITELYLNYARGWSGESIAFLKTLPFLRALRIVDWRLQDDTPISELEELEYLQLNTLCKNNLDFSRLVRLTRCSLHWRKSAQSLFESNSVRELLVDRFTQKTAEPFARLKSIRSLSILNAASLSDISDLGRLSNLEYLLLSGLPRLSSLQGLGAALRLQKISINRCRAIRDVEPLATLPALESLELDDDGRISSLSPLRYAMELRSLRLSGSTNVEDGELGFVFGLPNLRELAFVPRKHYSNDLTDFWQCSQSPRRSELIASLREALRSQKESSPGQ